MGWSRVVLLVTLTGCQGLLGITGFTLAADAGVDVSILPDASACLSVGAECVSPTVLRSCTSVGAAAVDTTCGWGCLAGLAAHCGAIVPAGGGVTTSDLDSTALADVTLPSAIVIDGNDGKIGTTGNPSSIRGPGTGPVAGIDYELRGTIAVFRFKSLAVTGALAGAGPYSIALVADGLIDVGGVIDMRGGCALGDAGPGGYKGGDAGLVGAGPGGGQAGTQTRRAGGGGGHGGAGGGGGNDGVALTPGGPAFGDATISILTGGGGGGGGGDSTKGGAGGGGGGAIQLVSNASIHIAALSGINAGGCGGKPPSDGSGGGGGAGGTILLEAPVVDLAGTLAVGGGGGAGGSSSGIGGEAGAFGRIAAAGGTGDGLGGTGGAASVLDGGAGTYVNRSGGGGAGVGRIRVNTRTGMMVLGGGAVMSPSLTDAPTTCTQSTATIQ